MEFKDNLKKYRKLNNLTQKELANLLGKNQVTIARYETGMIVPPLKVIEEIAKILNISTKDLLMGENIKVNSNNSIEEWQKQLYFKGKIQSKFSSYLERLGYSIAVIETPNGANEDILLTNDDHFYKIPYDELDEFMKMINMYVSFLLLKYEIDKEDAELY